MIHLPIAPLSLWQDSSHGQKYEPLRGKIRVDVAIVGGGITGLTAAKLLSLAGKKVAVLEARRILDGVTGKTTAHLTLALDTRYYKIAHDFGREGAREAAASHRAAIEKIAELVSREKANCGFERVPGYLFVEGEDDPDEIEKEMETLSRIDVACSRVASVPLPFETSGAIRFENQAQIHPRDYLFKLAQGIHDPARGSYIFENTRVLNITEGEPSRVEAEPGVVLADDVIVAANVPINNRFFLHTKLAPYRSYVLAAPTKPATGIGKGLFWNTQDPYRYIRTQVVNGVEYLLVGGEDHKTGHMDDTELPYQRLYEYVRTHFDVEAVSHRWSAQVIEPVDGLAFIGRNSLSERIYVATGYSGNGITYGTLAAMILRDAVLGIANRWSELYSATRVKPLASARDFVAENVDYPLQLVKDRFKKGDLASVSELRRDDGGLIEIKGEILAVYRDRRGELCAHSSICPHMGCRVAWNQAEKSWDCPCHGSRFGLDGGVINGPALRGLEPRAIEKRERKKGAA